MPPLVSVVAPFYNENRNPTLLAERLDAVFDSLEGYTCEYVFVNDGSTDGTGAELDRIALVNPRVKALHFRQNCGQSAALVAGMRRSEAYHLKRDQIDLKNRSILLLTTKTGEARVCRIPQFLTDRLAAHFEAHPEGTWLFEHPKKPGE